MFSRQELELHSHIADVEHRIGELKDDIQRERYMHRKFGMSLDKTLYVNKKVLQTLKLMSRYTFTVDNGMNLTH